VQIILCCLLLTKLILFFTEHFSYIMILSEIYDHEIISNEGHQILYNKWKCMSKKKALNGNKNHVVRQEHKPNISETDTTLLVAYPVSPFPDILTTNLIGQQATHKPPTHTDGIRVWTSVQCYHNTGHKASCTIKSAPTYKHKSIQLHNQSWGLLLFPMV
jgi:hypothetical protein